MKIFLQLLQLTPVKIPLEHVPAVGLDDLPVVKGELEVLGRMNHLPRVSHNGLGSVVSSQNLLLAGHQLRHIGDAHRVPPGVSRGLREDLQQVELLEIQAGFLKDLPRGGHLNTLPDLHKATGDGQARWGILPLHQHDPNELEPRV